MSGVRMAQRLALLSFVLIGACATSSRCSDAGMALVEAMERQDRREVERLLLAGADVRTQQVDGMTALHWSVYHEDDELVERLIQVGADVSARTRYQITPLALACQNGSEAIVRRLLAAGADPTVSLNGGESPLMIAARTGRAGPVRELLSRNVDVDATDHRGQTALMWAAAEGHLEVVDLLLQHGADWSRTLKSGFTPFLFAVREGRTEVARRLLQAGVDVNYAVAPEKNGGLRPGITALLLAIENGHFETALALLQAGAEPNQQEVGYAPLHAITWVRKPIRGDGDPPPLGSGKLTSLEMVRQLVAHGADLNLRQAKGESGRGRFTTTGSTPFLLAARASDLPLMQLLVELGADPTIPNNDGSSPLLAAAGVGALGDGDETAGTEEEAIQAVQFLLDLGADVNAVDEHGETAMHGAAYQSRAKLVGLLQERGAKVEIWNRQNEWGWTPLLIADGHRPGNFRPAPDTIQAIESILRRSQLDPDEQRRDE